MAVSDASDSVVFSNVKTVGEMLAFQAGLLAANTVGAQQLAQLNAVSHQQAMNTVLSAAVGAIAHKFVTVDPTEAISNLKEMTGDDLAQKLANLLASLSSGQIVAKEAQTTPPPTGGV